MCASGDRLAYFAKMSSEQGEKDEETKVTEFCDMGLDDRLLKAIAKLGWSSPTPIQEKGIQLALEGKDILARARTGSGKTAAYAIPVIQKILTSKQLSREQCVRAVIVTPTKELCNQAARNIAELCCSCSREVRCIDVSAQMPLDAQKPLLLDQPDIVVGTPSRILAHCNAGNLQLKSSLELFVIDEGDLLFSFGYEDDAKALLNHLPKIYQAFLMSATLTDEVKTLKRLVLHNPVTLKLEEPKSPAGNLLTQYHIKCEEEDKFVLLYSLLKLQLVHGKSIVFVNSIDRSYRLKLFLEQFGISSCVLNSELPVSSRVHIVNQFNEGLYDIIIAADELVLQEPEARPRKRKKVAKDKECGISRGIDFQYVSNVINFDFPRNEDSYIHRVGRTARGDKHGTALSFVCIAEMDRLKKVEELQEQMGNPFKPFHFKMEEIEGFRYRAKDAMRAVTKVAVREARLKEIRSELLNSKKLKSYFEDNPRDLQLLRHDKSLRTVKTQEHMQNVPDYLVPRALKGVSKMRRRNRQEQTQGSYHRGPTKTQRKFQRNKADPLKSFELSGIGGKRKR